MKKSTSIIVSGLAFAAVLVIGYLAFPGEPAPKKEVKEEVFGYENIKNAVYDGVQLSEGSASGNETGEASPNLIRNISLVPEYAASGDLDGDGAADLAVLAVEDFGGSGIFNYIAIYYSRGDEAEYAGKIFLGDRIQARSLAIEDDSLIAATIVSHTSDDAIAYPTKIVSLKYEMRSSGPVEINREDIGRISDGREN